MFEEAESYGDSKWESGSTLEVQEGQCMLHQWWNAASILAGWSHSSNDKAAVDFFPFHMGNFAYF